MDHNWIVTSWNYPWQNRWIPRVSPVASINAIPCHGRALNWSWVLRSFVRYNLIFHPFRMYSRCPSFWNIFIFSSLLEYFSNFHLKWVFGTLVLHFMPISQGEGWCTKKALTPHNLQTVFWRGLVPNPVAWHISLQFFYFNYFFSSYWFIKFLILIISYYFSFGSYWASCD